MKSLKVNDLSFSYHKDNLVIKKMNAYFSEKQIHTILGLNGSGKTTLIKLLAGLFKPMSGQVYLEDEDIHNIDYLTRSKYVSYVRQGSSTGDDHFVKDYLSFGMMNKLLWYQSPSRDHLSYVYETAKKFNIEHFLNKKMNELSGGEKQVVMICRAFIQDTDIIILDEPTSALDFKNQSLILKVLKEIVSHDGKTIILSTHNPNHALFLDSNVILIHQGEIIEQGFAKDIITIDKLKSIYGETVVYSKNLSYDEVTVK